MSAARNTASTSERNDPGEDAPPKADVAELGRVDPPVSSFAAVRACLELLPRRLRWAWFAMVPLQASCALAEVLAAAGLYRILSWVLDPAASAGRFALPATTLARVGLWLGALFVLKNLWIGAAHLAHTWLLASSLSAAFHAVVGRWLTAPFDLHVRGRSADIIHDATEGVDVAFRQVMYSATGVLAELLVVMAVGALLAWHAPGLVMAVGLGVVPLIAALLALTRRLSHRWGERGSALGRRLVAELQTLTAGVRELKVFRRERHFLEQTHATHRALTRVFRSHTGVSAMPRLLIETIFVAAAVILLLLGGDARTGTSALPLFALFAYVGFRVIPSANRIVYGLDQIRYGSAGVARLREHVRRLGGSETAAGEGSSPQPLPDTIELVEAGYRHPGASSPALRGLSFLVRKGEMIGVVGPTGAGKSTLLDLLAGLLEPTSGRLLVGGGTLRTWREDGGVVGYVAQRPWLLDDSIAGNVAFGVPPARIDREGVARALETACLGEVVHALPEGIDTPIGEWGARLSGGERQRLAIARSLYPTPELLLLDEGTAALDAATEARVLGNLRASGVTTVLVAHRLHALRLCDRLLLLDAGALRAQGTWEALYRLEPLFRELAADEGR